MKLSAASWGGWLLETEGALIGYDGENLSYTLEIDAAADVTGYAMYADLEYQDGTKGTLPLVKQNGTLRATVGAGYLIPGWAKIQLRGVGTASGTDAPPVKKSSMSRVRIGPSVNASETLPAPDQAAWDTYAAQMAALRDQAQKAAESVPEIEKKIGDLDKLTTTDKSTLVAAINEAAHSGGGGGGSAVLYTAQELTAAQQKQARENIDVAGYNVINCLWPTEHSGREDTDITTLLDSDVYMGIVKNSTAFPSPGLVMLQGPMSGDVYTAVLLAKDSRTYTATFQYMPSTNRFEVLGPVAAASSKLISVKLTPSESDENVYTADRNVNEINRALQAGHMALAYTPDAAGLQNSVGLITSCVSNFVTVLDCLNSRLGSTKWHVDVDGRTWTKTDYAEYAASGRVAALESAMPHPVGKTDAMTQAVGMDETGKLWTQPGASNADISLGVTGAEVGQIIKVLSVGEDGKPTSYETVKMPGHWETVLEKIWDEPCIHPTAFDAETKTFTCDADEIAWMELNKSYSFSIAPTKSNIAYDTRMVNQYSNVPLTRTGDRTLTTSQTVLSTFDFANWQFTRIRGVKLTGLNTKKIRVNFSGRFLPPLSMYEYLGFGVDKTFAQYANSYVNFLPAYEATLQMEWELIAPFTISGPVICCTNGPSSNASYHFKNNSVASMIKPVSKANIANKQLVFSESGDTIIGFYTSVKPWLCDNDGYPVLSNVQDAFELCAGTYVKIEQWVEG